MKRVALYVRSFDPPHLGQSETVRRLLDAGDVDEIWLVPGESDLEPVRSISPLDDRKAMVSLMLATVFAPNVPVYLHVLQRRFSWEHRGLEEMAADLERRYPRHRFFWIIDEELLEQPDALRVIARLGDQQARLLVISRTIPVGLGKKVKWIKLRARALRASSEMSTAALRTPAEKADRLKRFVPQAVINHIVRNRLYTSRPRRAVESAATVLAEGIYLRYLIKDGWEYVERPGHIGAVLIVAVTSEKKLLLTEQFRIPVGKPVIELPAGLVGDHRAHRDESVTVAAQRELLEETGYEAYQIVPLAGGPTSAGLSGETVTMVQAIGLTKRSHGGGEGSENIILHEVPLQEAESWLCRMEAQGRAIDLKVRSALYFIQQAKSRASNSDATAVA